MSSSEKNRITVKIKRPNPLFETWLEEWQKEATENGLKSQYTFGKALKSLRKYPLLLESGKECLILDGFGKHLCAALDNKLNEYKKCKSHLFLSNNENITVKHGKNQNPKRKSTASEKEDEFRMKYSEENSVLITLLIESQKENYRGYMLRDEIIDLSKQLCDKPLVESNSDNTISLSCVLEKLTLDGLVNDILGRYSLTDQGISVAFKLYTENENLSEEESTAKDNVKNKRNHTDVEKQTPSKRKKKLNTSKTKQYVPTWRSGGYAILFALYEESKAENYAGYMLKNEIINKAKQHCDKSFTKPDPGSFYTAWSSMSTLISKGLVSRKSSPAKFSLTDEGMDIASRLCNATTAGDSDKNKSEEDVNSFENKHLMINLDLDDAVGSDVNESFRSPSRNEGMSVCEHLDASTEVNAVSNGQKMQIDNQKSAILILLFKESQKKHYRGYTSEQEIITLMESCDNITPIESLINEGLVSENSPSCYLLTDKGMDAAIHFYYNIKKDSMESLKEQDLDTNNTNYEMPGHVTSAVISRTKKIDDLIQKYSKYNAFQTYSTVVSSDSKKEMEICVIDSDNEKDKEILESKKYSDSDEDFLCTPSVIKKTNEMFSCINDPPFSDYSANLNVDNITENIASNDDEIGTCILSNRNQTHIEQIIDKHDFNSLYGNSVPSDSKSNPENNALSSDTDELNFDLICKRKQALKYNSKTRSRKKLKEKISSSDSDGDIDNVCKKSKIMTKKRHLLCGTRKENISSSDSQDNLIYKEKRIALQNLKKHANAYQDTSNSNEDDATYETRLCITSKSKQANDGKVSFDKNNDCIDSLNRNDKNFTDAKYDLEKRIINYDTSKLSELDRYSVSNKNKLDENNENIFRDDFSENIPVPLSSKGIFKPKIHVMKNVSQHSNSEPLSAFKLDNQCVQTSGLDIESGVTFYPRTFEIILLVDTQETSGKSSKNDVTVTELEHLKVKFEVCHLNVGDFAWICRNQFGQELVLPYIVERKRMDDLGMSIRDGRYHEQKFRMKQSGVQNLIYLIESHGNNQHTGLPITTLYQAAVNTTVQDGFTVKYTSCHRNSMEYVARLTRFLIKLYTDKTLHGCVQLSLTESSPKDKIARLLLFSEFHAGAKKGKNATVQQLFIRQLLQLKGMSVDKAAAITEKYPTPTVLYETYKNTTSKEGEKLLSSIKSQKRCIGPIISKAIYKLYTENEF